MFLYSDIYSPEGESFEVKTADLEQHKTWMKSVNARLPAGSNYFIEVCHNGNGNIEVSFVILFFLAKTNCHFARMPW